MKNMFLILGLSIIMLLGSSCSTYRFEVVSCDSTSFQNKRVTEVERGKLDYYLMGAVRSKATSLPSISGCYNLKVYRNAGDLLVAVFTLGIYTPVTYVKGAPLASD